MKSLSTDQLRATNDSEGGSSNDEMQSDRPSSDEIDVTGRAPRRSSLRRNAPRVIGIKKEQKKKGPRFAKKSESNSSATESPTHTTSEQVGLTFMNEEITPKEPEQEENSSSAFSFISETTDETATTEPNDDESAFGFINDTPVEIVSPPEETDPIIEAPPVAEINETIQEIQEYENTMPLVSAEVLIEQLKQVQNAELIQKEFESTPDCDKSSEKYDEIQYKSYSTRKDFMDSLQQCMFVIQSMPKTFTEKISKDESAIPKKEETVINIHRQLAELNEKQITESADLDLKRAMNASQFKQINVPIEQHKADYERDLLEFNMRVEDATRTSTDAILDLEAERDVENDRIKELLEEIEKHRRVVSELEQKISEENKKKQFIISTFGKEQDQLTQRKQEIEKEEIAAQKRIQEIEAPYQSLIDSVNARTKKIDELSALAEKITDEIAETKKAISNSEEVNDILTQVSDKFNNYQRERNNLFDSIAEISSTVNSNEKKLLKLSDDSYQMSIEVERDENSIADIEARIGVLEEAKKSAVANKNFLEAKKVNQDLKELTEQRDSQMAAFHEKQRHCQEMEANVEKLTSSVSEDEMKLKDMTQKLVELDYDYFFEANSQFSTLFDLSGGLKESLEGLASVFKMALEGAEKPAGLSIEALQAKLDKAIADEDFDLAEKIQAQLDAADM